MTITNDEVDRQLKNHGIDIGLLKGEFASLFPDAAKLLELGAKPSQALWFGFKAGYVWAYRLVES